MIQEGEGYYREKDGEVEQVLVTLYRLSGGGPGGREGEEEKRISGDMKKRRISERRRNGAIS